MAPTFIQRRTPGGIPYTELIEGHEESWSEEVDHASKVVEVADSQRHAFVVEMRGYSVTGQYLFGSGVGGTVPVPGAPVAPSLGHAPIPAKSRWLIDRHLPMPHSRQLPWLFCSGADLLMRYGNPRTATGAAAAANLATLGINFDAGDAVFDRARYKLHFTPRKYQLLPNLPVWMDEQDGELHRYVERACGHSADNIPIPSGSFKWVTAPHDAIQEGGVPKVFPVQELTYTFHEMPGILLPAWREIVKTNIGAVNTYAFDINPPALVPPPSVFAIWGLFFNSAVLGQGPGYLVPPRGYPPGTLLCIGAEEEAVKPIDNAVEAFTSLPFWTTANLRLWYLQYRFKLRFLYRENGVVGVGNNQTAWAGWNYLYRGPSFSPKFQLVSSSGTAGGAAIYEQSDFSLFWRFALLRSRTGVG